MSLQCGHDPKAVENGRGGQSADGQGPASMRPRPEGRGERPGKPDEAAAVIEASMRPQPEGRGERCRARARRPRGWASMRPQPEGRGEPSRRRNSPRGARCFNAATTRRPWRTAEGGARFCVRPLQCGHSPKAVENDPDLARHERAAAQASMRPRPVGRVEPTCPAAWTACRTSFNAATTRRPWRTGSSESWPRSSRPLQCGHDPKAVENRCPAARSSPARRGRFNAATTRRPWRTGQFGNAAVVPGERFNAATTRRPWRTMSVGSRITFVV